MPSLFSRRRASTGQAHHAPVSSSAAIAASSAFLKNSPSTTSLSSAAAAAALRSHTTSPEPIGNLQTKRMVRRASQSSNGSASGLGGSRTLLAPRPVQRRSSSASMSERTFRSPSPGRSISPRPPIPASEDAPPVPSIPKSATRSREIQRPASAASSIPRSHPKPTLKIAEEGEAGHAGDSSRDDARNSINFSRHIGSPNGTPPVSPTRPKTAGSWFGSPTETDVRAKETIKDRPRPNSALSNGEISRIEANLQSVASTRSQKKKKQKQTAHSQPGSQLAAKTMRTGPDTNVIRGRSTANVASKAQASAVSTKGDVVQSPKTSKAGNAVESSVTDDSYDVEASQISHPKTSRKVSSALTKQPSVVMEENEPHDGNTPQDGPYPHLSPQTPPASAQRSPSLSASSTNSQRVGMRPPSLEVPDSYKSAHFNNQVVDSPSGVRHNPPPRSISPAKSALKHSPSSSLRGTSPVATSSPQTSNNPAGDASDAMSMASQDGSRSGKKKKAVRVSFDESAIAAATHHDENSPTNGNGKPLRRSLSPRSAPDAEDETMRPRPALPSFGSVRNQSPRAEPSVAEKVTETLPDTRQGTEHFPQGASNDHIVGALLAAEHQRSEETRANTSEPLPPQVTSVDTPVHFDDSDSSDDEIHVVRPPLSPIDEAVTPLEIDMTLAPESKENVPDIRVQPATPGIEEKPAAAGEPNATPKAVPGGWNESPDPTPLESPDPLPLQDSPRPSSPFRTSTVLKGMDNDDSDSDSSGAFSDAAEDPSELEPFGYASLDAIVESPVPVARNRADDTSSPSISSPPLESSPEVGSSSEARNDWSSASAYWKQQKQQLQTRESGQPGESVPAKAAPREPVSGPRPRKTKATPDKVANAAPVPAQARSTVKQDPTSRPMRSSMRGPAPKVADERPTAFQKTMRQNANQGAGGARLAPLPLQESKTALQRKTMKVTTPQSSSPFNEQAKTVQSKGKPSALAPSADSDSESSFRRKRRAPNSDATGRYTMRRSMRSGSVDRERERRPSSPQDFAGSSKWSIRSASPTMQSPASNRSTLRQSLRGNAIPGAPTLRGEKSLAREKSPMGSLRFGGSGFSKPSKSSATPAGKRNSSKLGFKSRIVDSDSEDDGPHSARPTAGGFRSRIADSDDEDDIQPRNMPADLTPVRGIPRSTKATEQDSTDLDDSSDDEFSRRRRAKRDSGRSTSKPVVPSQADIDKAMAIARQNVAAMTGNQDLLRSDEPQPTSKLPKRVSMQPTPEAITSRPTSPDPSGVTRKRGLLGSIFGRRSSSDSVKPPSAAAPQQTEMTPPQSPRGKLQRRNTPKMKRSASESSTATVETVAPTQVAPRGQMPSVEEGEEENEWPLAPPPRIPAAMAENDRPASSDGVAESAKTKTAAARPVLARRSQSGGGPSNEAVDDAVHSKRTGKKKRFGKLRKAFGLHD